MSLGPRPRPQYLSLRRRRAHRVTPHIRRRMARAASEALGKERFCPQSPPKNRNMKFMMLMIPASYRGNKKPDDPHFPDPKMLEKMGKYNEELGKVFKITDLNGLHPLTTGARVSFTKGKTTVTDGPFIETKEVLGGYW